MLVSFFADCSILEKWAMCSPGSSVNFHRASWWYIPEDRTPHSHRCWVPKSNRDGSEAAYDMKFLVSVHHLASYDVSVYKRIFTGPSFVTSKWSVLCSIDIHFLDVHQRLKWRIVRSEMKWTHWSDRYQLSRTMNVYSYYSQRNNNVNLFI
jgi:hypothetical protein